MHKQKTGAFTQKGFVHSQNPDRVLANKELSAYAENITYLQNIYLYTQYQVLNLIHLFT